MASLLEAKQKLKKEASKAAQQQRAAARKQSRLKVKAQNLSNGELIEIIQQRRQLQAAANKRADAAAEATGEQKGKKKAKKATREGS